MIYRFKLVSDEVNGFYRVIDINPSDTFLSLRKVILESVGYTDVNIDSFFICSDNWEKGEEVALVDMGLTASDHDLWTMDTTRINELVNNEGQKLVFTFDNLNDRCFFMELKEVVCGESIETAICSSKKGKAPKQDLGFSEFDNLTDNSKNSKDEVEDIFSSDFADGYDLEDTEGFRDIDESDYQNYN